MHERSQSFASLQPLFTWAFFCKPLTYSMYGMHTVGNWLWRYVLLEEA